MQEVTVENYNPYGVELFAHQRLTMKFILKYRRCFVFDDIGTGKTMTALSVSDFLMIYGKITKVLIISPISVIRATWCKHILHFFPGRSFTVLHGSTSAKRRANLALKCDFYIINTDGIKVIESDLIRKRFDIIIIDESTAYSRHTSNRTKCAWRLCRDVSGVIVMTGNPIPNDSIQSFGQAKLINFNRPKYFTTFRDQLKIKLDEYTYIDKDNAVELAYAVLTPSIRHKIEDCIDLPPISYQYRDIPLSAEQEKHYKLMEKEYITWLQSGASVTAANAAVKGLKLLQISSGIIINKEGIEYIDNSGKVNELKEIISQTKKLVIFASFTGVINDLVSKIPGSAKIDGSVSGDQRYNLISAFQDGDLDILICQPGAISHGVTLHASHTIVWFSPPYSNEHFIQCNGRIRRAGQTHHQLIIQFRSTSIERKVYAALNTKQDVSKAFLTMAEIDTDELK